MTIRKILSSLFVLFLVIKVGVGVGWTQGFIQVPPANWDIVGAGALVARPVTCKANQQVFVCNGAGCTTNGEYHYCTALNTWTVASGAPVGGGAPIGGSGTTNYLPKFTGATTIGNSRVVETDSALTAPTLGAEIIPSTSFANGLTGWTVVPAAAVGVFVFTGAGLDDATAGGTSTYGGTTFTVEIDASVPTPDTFRWRRGTGAWTNGVAITGAAQALSDGFTVTFAAVDGHTVGDVWVSTVTSGWAINPVTGHPAGLDYDELSIATGGAGKVLVTVTVSKLGTYVSYGPAIGIYDDDYSLYVEMTKVRTYSYITDAGTITFYSYGDGWEISDVSVQSYSVPYTTPIPAFVSATDGTNSVFNFEVRYPGFSLGLGYGALDNNTGSYVTAMGNSSASNNTGTYVAATGFYSASNNTGNDVAATGLYSASNNTGDGVVATGSSSASYNTGSYVTATGFYSASYSTGSNVTATGNVSARENTGSNVTATGNASARGNTGSHVAATGDYSVYKNTGSNVTATGSYSAPTKTGGDYSTFVGAGAAYNSDVLTGTQKAIEKSTILGALGAGTQVNNSGGTMLTNIIAINGVATDSNQTVIGNAATATTRIYGNFDPTVNNLPTWQKYSLVKIANGVNGCANANGCWQVNGVLGANAAAGLTQDVVLHALPAKAQVTDWRVKTATVCTGATTALSGLGNTGNTVLYRAQTYDIAAAVADANLSTGPTAGAGSNTAAGTNAVASLITTVANVDQLVAGCAVDYWILWGVLP